MPLGRACTEKRQGCASRQLQPLATAEKEGSTAVLYCFEPFSTSYSLPLQEDPWLTP